MSPFDYVKSILSSNQYLMNSVNDEGEYVPWISNRAISVFPDTVFFAEEMNMYPKLPSKMQYDYMFNSIRKTKRPFIKYPKKEKSENIALIMEMYKYSSRKAFDAISILSTEDLDNLREMYNKGE